MAKENQTDMKKKYSNWNVIAVSKTDLGPFLSAIEANQRYEYRLLPEIVTKNYTPEAFISRGIVLIPVFFQASISELENYILDLPEEIMVNLYDRCKPIKDNVMQLALSVANKKPSKVNISADTIEDIAKTGHADNKEFGSLGTFQGYISVNNGTKCFCLPFGSQTLIINE